MPVGIVPWFILNVEQNSQSVSQPNPDGVSACAQRRTVERVPDLCTHCRMHHGHFPNPDPGQVSGRFHRRFVPSTLDVAGQCGNICLDRCRTLK